MSTRRDIDIALVMLRAAHYTTGPVRPEHLRLADGSRATDGTVTDWLTGMPAPTLEHLLDRLADRGFENPSVLDAERLLATLDVLLPGETLIHEASLHRVHHPLYAVHLDTLSADHAARAFSFLQTRHTAGLAPLRLLDTSYRAVRMLEEHMIPDVQRDPFVQPTVTALRAAVTWMLVRHGDDITGDRLRDALKAANW
jgi:hypothetical protein